MLVLQFPMLYLVLVSKIQQTAAVLAAV